MKKTKSKWVTLTATILGFFLLFVVVMLVPTSLEAGVSTIRVEWNNDSNWIAGPDTVYSHIFTIKDWTGPFTFWYKWYSNQTCSVSVYFEEALASDTTTVGYIRFDTLFIAPPESPGDSTLISSWTIQTSPLWLAATNWLIPGYKMRIKVDTRYNGATDTLHYLDSVWISRVQ